jgi:hypothetical protein
MINKKGFKMLEETIVKALITRLTNKVFDLFVEPKTDTGKDTSNINEEKIKLLIEEKIEQEFNNLQTASNEVQLLEAVRSSFVHRIHNLFKIFDIRIEEIPVFLKSFNISNKDILYEENLLEKFDNDVIEFICNTLEIKQDWIYGRTSTMIPIQSHGYYKKSRSFYKELIDSNPMNIYIFTERKPDKNIDEKKDDNRIYIIVEYYKGSINNREIKSYKIYDDTCRYGYFKCRYGLKKFILSFKKDHKLNNYLSGRVLPNLSQNIYNFSDGKISFDDLIISSQLWYPEDYVDLPEQSACAKTDELEELKMIIDEFNQVTEY